jgi:hypothetical protein
MGMSLLSAARAGGFYVAGIGCEEECAKNQAKGQGLQWSATPKCARVYNENLEVGSFAKKK